jgi:hypothetical protein
VGPLLLQEQAHPTVYAELLYRHASNSTSGNNSGDGALAAAGQVRTRYAPVVSQTAEFLSSFALQSNSSKGPFNRGCLNAGPPMAPGMGVETDGPGMHSRTNWTNTANGCYENTYWLYDLEVAQQWRERQGLPRSREWAAVASTLCRPQQRPWNGSLVYFFDGGSNALVGPATALGQLYACGHLPCLNHGINATVMRNTLALSTAVFNWDISYPSDNMVYAMAAARLGQPEVALETFLKNTSTNIYSPRNGNWQGFCPVLTSTPGGLLYAIAMLVGGWDGDGGQPATEGLRALRVWRGCVWRGCARSSRSGTAHGLDRPAPSLPLWAMGRCRVLGWQGYAKCHCPEARSKQPRRFLSPSSCQQQAAAAGMPAGIMPDASWQLREVSG